MTCRRALASFAGLSAQEQEHEDGLVLQHLERCNACATFVAALVPDPADPAPAPLPMIPPRLRNALPMLHPVELFFLVADGQTISLPGVCLPATQRAGANEQADRGKHTSEAPTVPALQFLWQWFATQHLAFLTVGIVAAVLIILFCVREGFPHSAAYFELQPKGSPLVPHRVAMAHVPSLLPAVYTMQQQIPDADGTTSQRVIAFNAGGSAVAPFGADAQVTGGTAAVYAKSIDRTGVTDPAPEAVYQSER